MLQMCDFCPFNACVSGVACMHVYFNFGIDFHGIMASSSKLRTCQLYLFHTHTALVTYVLLHNSGIYFENTILGVADSDHIFLKIFS